MSDYAARTEVVTELKYGSEVAIAASIGATALTVDDVNSFLPEDQPGQVLIGGTVYDYLSCDDDADTITLASPGLIAAAAVGDRVDLWDASLGKVAVEYEADLSDDDGDDAGDPLQATVDHSLVALLSRGVRGEATEATTVTEDGDSVRVRNVTGKAPDLQAESGVIENDLTVGTTLKAQALEVTDDIVDFTFGPQGAAGSPGFAWTYGTTTGWFFIDPSTGIVTIQADVTDSTKGTIQLNLAAISGPAVSFVGKTQATGELHGQTVWVDSVPTTSNAANTNMGTSGQLQKSTSSRRYKKAIKDAALDLDAVLAMRPRSWVSKNAEDGTGRYVGFIAEEVDELGLTELVVYDDDHRPDGFAYPTLVTHLTALCQQQQTQIDDLTRRLEALEQGA